MTCCEAAAKSPSLMPTCESHFTVAHDARQPSGFGLGLEPCNDCDRCRARLFLSDHRSLCKDICTGGQCFIPSIILSMYGSRGAQAQNSSPSGRAVTPRKLCEKFGGYGSLPLAPGKVNEWCGGVTWSTSTKNWKLRKLRRRQSTRYQHQLNRRSWQRSGSPKMLQY
jgi:hypothetical protein